MDVIAKDLPCLHGSFATIDGCKLIVRQVECNDGHHFLDMYLVLFLHLDSPLEGGVSLNLSTMHQRSTEVNPISILNFSILKFFSSITLALSPSSGVILH